MSEGYELEKSVYEIDIVQTGDDKVLQAAKALEKEEAGIDRLVSAMHQHEQAGEKFVATSNAMAAAATRVDASAGASGAKLLALGNVLDDLQYVGEQGLRPIINNVMQIAPAAGIALIAADQLYKHWDDLMALMGQGFAQPALTGTEKLAEGLKKATAEMEGLMKQTRLEWYELKRLTELKGQIEELAKSLESEKIVKSATDALSDGEKARASGFGKAVAESGGKNALDEYKDKLQDSADAKGMVYNEATGKMSSVDDAARDTFAAALKGDKVARDAISKTVGPKSRFARNINKFSPEAQADADRQAHEAERVNAGLDQEEVAKGVDKKAKDKKDKEVDDIVQGIQDDLDAQDAADRHKELQRQEHAAKAVGGAFEQYNGSVGDIYKKAAEAQSGGRSQVIGSAGLADSIQAGVGAKDPAMQTVDELKKANDALIKILNKPENRIAVAG